MRKHSLPRQFYMADRLIRKLHRLDYLASKGLALKSVEFKTAGIQVTCNVAVTCYWISDKWLDKDGKGAVYASRITYTWLKNGGNWQIMECPCRNQ